MTTQQDIRWKQRLTFVGIVLVSIFVCFASSFAIQGNLPVKKELKVCSELAFLPLEMKSKEGKAYGYEIDLLNNFADEYNYTIKYYEVAWTASIPSLQSKKCDLIASGMSSTPERDKIVNFTNSTYDVVDNFVYKNKENLKQKFKTLQDFDKPGVVIGVRQGNEVDLYLRYFKNAKVLQFPNSDADVINALLEDKVSAIALHSPTAISTAAINKDKIYIFPEAIPTGTLHIAYAIRKDSTGDKLQKEFNNFFEKFKQTNEFKNIYSYYFSTGSWLERTR